MSRIFLVSALLCCNCAHQETDLLPAKLMVPTDTFTIEIVDAPAISGRGVFFGINVDVDDTKRGYYTTAALETEAVFKLMAPKGSKIHFYGTMSDKQQQIPFCGKLRIRRNNAAVKYRLVRKKLSIRMASCTYYVN